MIYLLCAVDQNEPEEDNDDAGLDNTVEAETAEAADVFTSVDVVEGSSDPTAVDSSESGAADTVDSVDAAAASAGCGGVGSGSRKRARTQGTAV